MDNNLLEKILTTGVYTRDVMVLRDGSIHISTHISRIKVPMLRYIDGEICIQSQGRVTTKWVNCKIKDYRITWSFEKDDFLSDEEVKAYLNAQGGNNQ